jgi:4'-phosphopantetheinyl transferase
VTPVSPTACVPGWFLPPERLTLGSDEVHVWRAGLDQAPSQIRAFLPTLAADERARAERFQLKTSRERYIVARGVLRSILGTYLNRAPESLRFRYGSRGKPELVPESAEGVIRFNVSHSGRVALYAIASAREVGIDLELIRHRVRVEQMADRFFSRREIETLRALPTHLRRRAFFLCWTRKEAYIKAKGEGLSLPLDRFDVSLTPGEPAVLLSTQQDPDEAPRWSLQELSPAPGYVGALAVQGHGWSCSYWECPSFV